MRNGAVIYQMSKKQPNRSNRTQSLDEKKKRMKIIPSPTSSQNKIPSNSIENAFPKNNKFTKSVSDS